MTVQKDGHQGVMHFRLWRNEAKTGRPYWHDCFLQPEHAWWTEYRAGLPRTDHIWFHFPPGFSSFRWLPFSLSVHCLWFLQSLEPSDGGPPVSCSWDVVCCDEDMWCLRCFLPFGPYQLDCCIWLHDLYKPYMMDTTDKEWVLHLCEVEVSKGLEHSQERYCITWRDWRMDQKSWQNKIKYNYVNTL